MDKIEGSELVPVSLLSFWTRSNVAVFLLLLSVAVFLYFYLKDRSLGAEVKKNDDWAPWRRMTYPVFLLSFIFFCFSIITSGRFLDFYFFSTVFFLALVMKRVFTAEVQVVGSRLRSFAFIGIIIFFIVADISTLSSLKGDIKRNDFEAIKRTSEWVKDHSSEKETVFLYRWDDFPALFFFNQKNYYTMGIEPKALLEYRPNLFWKWYNIFLYNYYCEYPEDCLEEKKAVVESLGQDQSKIDAFNKENSKKIINSIRNDFKARYIISSSGDFNAVLWLNQDMFEDNYSYTSSETGAAAAAIKLK